MAPPKISQTHASKKTVRTERAGKKLRRWRFSRIGAHIRKHKRPELHKRKEGEGGKQQRKERKV